ncbi:copper homeostasis periplasmic binding protein CopC [Sphingomonas glacialis]|uniref:Copper resistance protein CopC n=1 Tax=Sphingomonas glacialis TaxID=658225 RepID=A0A502FD31_9SPHN|nr:copper homeostasis periplasmic binding protein CopC [Sphingomonas glacialis]TPG47199.1 copper resistance protein CopC [Sphingomonas glacialis]
MRRLSAILLPALLVSAPAFAHPKLLSSTPAADAVVAPVDRIELKFSEKLLAPMAGAELMMTEMPGMTMHAPMKMKLTTTVGATGDSLIATLPKPLPKGGYTFTYHVVSTDTHRIEGSYRFKVQ